MKCEIYYLRKHIIRYPKGVKQTYTLRQHKVINNRKGHRLMPCWISTLCTCHWQMLVHWPCWQGEVFRSSVQERKYWFFIPIFKGLLFNSNFSTEKGFCNPLQSAYTHDGCMIVTVLEYLCPPPPFEKGGASCFATVGMSVGRCVGRSPTPCATDNRRTLYPRTFKLCRCIVLDEKMIPIDIQVSRSMVTVKGQVYFRYVGEAGHLCFTNIYISLSSFWWFYNTFFF